MMLLTVDSKLDNMLRVREFGVISPELEILHAPPLKAQGSIQKRGQKDCKSQK